MKTELTEKKKKKGRPYENYIVKDNTIIQCLAQTHLSLVQMKIVGAFLSKIDHLENMPKTTEYVLSDLLNTINWGGNDKNYKTVLKEIRAIKRKDVILYREETDTFFSFEWFNDFELSPSKDKVIVQWGNAVPEYVSCLTENYATMLLENEMKLDSKFSTLLYELLSSYRKGGFLPIAIDDFRVKMGLYDFDRKIMKYETWKDLKRRVIDVAVKEVSEKTNIKNIKYTTKKIGKKINSIHFTFNDTMGTPDFYSDKTYVKGTEGQDIEIMDNQNMLNADGSISTYHTQRKKRKKRRIRPNYLESTTNYEERFEQMSRKGQFS